MNPFCPLPLAPEDQSFGPRLHEAMVTEIYKQSRVALVSLALPSFFMRLIVAEAVPRAPVLNWIFGALGLTILARVLWTSYLLRHPDRFPSIRGRHLAFAAGAAMTTSCFVALNLVVFPILGPFPLALLCVCQAGISATAMVTMACSPISYVAYMVPMIGSMILEVILHPTPVLAQTFVCILLAFAAAQLGVFVAVHRTMRDNFLGQLKLEDLALRDVLTGLRNRRFLKEFMDAEIPRVLRSWHPIALAAGQPPRNLGIIMLDIDHFKAVNDTHGHAAGDAVLRQVAALLKENTRRPDLLVRWGGEEFVILIMDTARTHPMIAAERIRKAMEAHVFRLPSGEGLKRTCSLGYAHLPFIPECPDALSWQQVLNLADGALYRAKLTGRNRAIGVQPGGVGVQPGAHSGTATALAEIGEDLEVALGAGLIRLTEEEVPTSAS